MMIVPMTVRSSHALTRFTSKAKRRNGDGLIVVDRNRMEQPDDAFIANAKRDHAENDRAREACQVAELAGAEGETARR